MTLEDRSTRRTSDSAQANPEPAGTLPLPGNGPASSLPLKKLPLVDRFDRVHRSLRLSVTDRCNIRCQYCMPELASFLPHQHLLSFDEIESFVRTVATLGIHEVRITGGEPLMRPNLASLIKRLASISTLTDIALTTNGMLLSEQLSDLVAAGLKRINISLDTLSDEIFRRLSRRDGLEQVLAGIDAAAGHPQVTVRLNALVMRDINLCEVVELVEFATERGLPMRFIEFMPLDAERAWSRKQMVTGQELRELLSRRFGALTAVPRTDPSQPSVDFQLGKSGGVVGFIDSVSQPFCSSCDRLRLTADGKLRNCLFSQREWEIRPFLSAEPPCSNKAGANDQRSKINVLQSRRRTCRATRHCNWNESYANALRPSMRLMALIRTSFGLQNAPCIKSVADGMNTPMKRICFDQAATSWPKLPAAIQAAHDFLLECGATSGRGSYASARSADLLVQKARLQLAQLVGTSDTNAVAFCSSGTHALNSLLLGAIREGDCVLTTAVEHNSVLRPLDHLRRTAKLQMHIVPCSRNGVVDLDAARNVAVRERPRVIMVSHASNVTGSCQDLNAWSQIAHDVGAWLFVDASQTLGYLPMHMDRLGIDALASAGHKGLGALPGTGLIVASESVRHELRPLMFGGTGTSSERMDAELTWPHSVEVGNLNLPAIASLHAAAEHWNSQPSTLENWRHALKHLVHGICDLERSDRLKMFGHENEVGCIDWLPIVSLTVEDWDVHELSAVLDSSFGIEARAGFHCAAAIHEFLGTLPSGGTLRLSLGHNSTALESDEVVHALSSIVNAS